MAIKSNNTKGNPYHDEGNGQFTSANEVGSQQNKENTDVENLPIKLKAGVDLNALKEKVAQMKGEQLVSNVNAPKTILDVEREGNEIIGSTGNVVGYDDSTDIEVAQELNTALKDVYNVFPELLKNELLIAYGTKYKNTSASSKKMSIYEDLLKQEPFASRVAEFSEFDIKLNMKAILFFALSIGDYFTNSIKFDENTSGMTSVNKATKDSLFPINPTTIKINPFLCQSKQRMFNWEAKGVILDCHFRVYDPNKQHGYSIAAHELGHHIDFCLKSFMTPQEKSERASLIRQGNASYKNSNSYSLWSTSASEISGYAATSGDEQVAEAFSDYFCNGEKATNHNKNIVKFYINIYQRVFANRK